MSDIEKWQLIGFMFCVMSALAVYASVRAAGMANDFWEEVEDDEE